MAKKETKEEEKKEKIPRTRNFTCIVYPDSAPENWIDILREQQVPAFISPLHDKDINPSSEGEFKKPHYHVIIMFEGPKTIEQAHAVFDLIGGVYPPETNPRETCVVKSLRGSARYLQHLDNPEKAYYGDKEVICLAGADYYVTCSLESDLMKVIREMQQFCNKTNCMSFSVLSDYAAAMRPDWHRALATKCSIFMSHYLKSRKWSVESGDCCLIDQETGEVLWGTPHVVDMIVESEV